MTSPRPHSWTETARRGAWDPYILVLAFQKLLLENASRPGPRPCGFCLATSPMAGQYLGWSRSPACLPGHSRLQPSSRAFYFEPPSPEDGVFLAGSVGQRLSLGVAVTLSGAFWGWEPDLGPRHELKHPAPLSLTCWLLRSRAQVLFSA